MKPYDHKKIESKWRKVWDTKKVYQTLNAAKAKAKKLAPYYVLDMFPYPSGSGLHVGHPRGYIASDVFARMKRMQGYNVLHPMGFDSFGLPAEQYAIQTGKNPVPFTNELVKRYREQLSILGFSFDWDRQVSTHDPEYYKWTQWIFLQIYNSYYDEKEQKARPITDLIKKFEKTDSNWKNLSEIEREKVLMNYRLAYQGYSEVNWCSELGTVLANDEIVERDGKMVSERGEYPVEKKSMRQWFMRITAYADRLLSGLETIDWPNNIKEIQRNWIGKSEGSEINFKIRTSNNPSPTLPQGEGVAPKYMTSNTQLYGKLHDTAVEMRKNPTAAEEKLWKLLKGDKIGYHFRRQHIIHAFVADFVCLEKMLIVEVDGDVHNNLKERDAERTQILESYGFRVVRFPNDEVLHQSEQVIKKITEELSREVLPLGEDLGGVSVFTTRADTLFGCTYIVLAPEHLLISQSKNSIKNWNHVAQYIEQVKSKSDEDRAAAKEKTGVELHGVFAINPANGEQVPVWVADYVLANYGTGAVMAVPAHDERDFEFAKKYDLPIREVIYVNLSNDRKSDPGSVNEYIDIYSMTPTDVPIEYDCWPGYGVLKNSEKFDGLTSAEAKKAITEFVGGKLVTKYKMRDAIFARQRYWGEPIPLVHHEAPVKIFFLIESLVKGAHKQLEKLSTSIQKHEDWGMYYFAEVAQLDSFVKKAQSLLLDGPWYFDVSGNRKMICFKKKTFDLTTSGENKKAMEYGRKLGIPEEQLDWKVEEVTKEEIIVPVSESKLPLKLPNVKSYQPSGTGESPLATVKEWVKSGYETNTMPGWAGSSWYFLRYMDPKNKKEFAGKKEIEYWKDVDMYVGGAEHATGHLLYSRFWNKVLKDLGYLKAEEPFKSLRNQGMIGGADGRKMSKRYGNVVNPDDVVRDLGADTLRVYEAFMGPFEGSLPWSTDGIVGARRFVEKVWRLASKIQDTETKIQTNATLQKILHKTIKKVSEDITNFSFNTAISSMMILTNEMEKAESIEADDFLKFLQILAPFAPHVSEELYQEISKSYKLKAKTSIHLSDWPTYYPLLIVDEEVTLGVQINGKVRAEIKVAKDASEADVKNMVLQMPDVAKWLEGKEIKKFIYIPSKIISIVV